MSEMVVLARFDGTIEYVNPRGSTFFDRLIEAKGSGTVQRHLHRIIKDLLNQEDGRLANVSIVRNLNLSCAIAPFIGYDGDDLFWLIFTLSGKRQKQHEPLRDTDATKIIGESKVMQNLYAIVDNVARTDTTVLITGESGTGKELVANYLKQQSKRKDKPFLTINCTTISELLLESELFGYEKGSFTGAHKQRKGKFEIADGGSIFLDEIGDISPRMQAALLRVLQNGEITRVGGHTTIKVDVRIIAATNRNLAEAVQNDLFRLDLFYRLNIINIHIPPLRSRVDDIPILAQYFIKKYNRLFGKNIDENSAGIITKLLDYRWPGNIRELDNVIHRAVLMCTDDHLREEDITFDMVTPKKDKMFDSGRLMQKYDGKPLKSIIHDFEKEIIIDALKSDQWNVSNASKSLEISKASMYEKMKRYNIPIKPTG